MSSVTDDHERYRGVQVTATVERKRIGLKRMRATATCLVAVMIALLCASVIWQTSYPWLTWLRAFAEAGTVGAIADWYAVVALFRHPLGIAMPHTAIIPKNQARIAESLGGFVEQHFLTTELVVGRLSEYNAARAAAQWLAAKDNSAAIADIVVDSLPRLLERVDESDVETLFERYLFPQLRVLDVSRLAGRVLGVLAEGNRHQPLLDRGLVALETWLTANVELIKAKFSEASRFTPAPLDGYIVNKFVEGIVALVHEVAANPDHELRHQFDAAVEALSVDLQTAADYRRFGRRLVRDCIRHVRGGDYARIVLDRVRTRVGAEIASGESNVRDVIASALASLGKTVTSASAIESKLNAWWLDVARTLVVRYRHQLSGLITDVVKGWDAQEVSGKFETEIGRDLQFIRINGTFVGGLVGVLIHTCVFVATR